MIFCKMKLPLSGLSGHSISQNNFNSKFHSLQHSLVALSAIVTLWESILDINITHTCMVKVSSVVPIACCIIVPPVWFCGRVIIWMATFRPRAAIIILCCASVAVAGSR